jgi:hypothetical protein
MALVFKSCPHCRAPLPETNASVYILPPIRICDKCSLNFRDPERNEWETGGIAFKFNCYFKFLASAVAYAIFLTGGIYWFCKSVLEVYIQIDVIGFVFFGLLMGFSFYLGGNLQKLILESKQRTSDPQYRQMLIRAGFQFKNNSKPNMN